MAASLPIAWHCAAFSALTPHDLHRLLALRAAVFVVEQQIVYLDPDHKDEHALHVTGTLGEELVACARILPAGVSYAEVSIGRVATAASVRKRGVGRALMRCTMAFAAQHFGTCAIRISAQSHLERFYAVRGFERVSAEYLEDGIPHIEMLFSPGR